MTKKIAISLVLLLLVVFGVKLAWDYYYGGGRFDRQMHDAHELMNSGKYQEARVVLEPISESYWVAKWQLALLYAGGLGVEFSKDKALELLKSVSNSDRPRPSARQCDQSVTDLAMEAKWVANELRQLGSERASQWDQISTELGYEQSKCPGIPAN